MTPTETTPEQRRQALRLMRRLVLALVTGLVLATAVAILVEQYRASADKSHFPAPGRLVDVGGWRMHLDCQGHGAVVVFEGGGLGLGTDWAKVAPEVAKFARACSYDRSGRGWSERSPDKRSAANIADELATLLERAGEKGPYVLVGHSVGGLYVRTFAQRHPEKTAGLVLVDAAHEASLSERDFGELLNKCRIARALVPFGFIRATGMFERSAAPVPELEPAAIALRNRHGYLRTTCSEIAALPESIGALRAQDRKLGDRPLSVITAAKLELPPGVSVGDYDERRLAWTDQQNELAQLSTQSTHVIAEKSGHLIHWTEPEVVIAAVQWVTSRVVRDAVEDGAGGGEPPSP